MSDTRPTLLVVDDEPEVLRSIHDLFRIGHRVLTFERGDEALAALEGEDPDVVMSDQRMPIMSGVEFLRRAKAIRPEATRLLFTGYADLKAIIDAINQGSVFRYVAKPWDVDELQAVVRQAIDHRRLLAEKRLLLAELRDSNARLLEANRLKGAFIEVASHELNTPVAVVLGMAELWKMTQGDQASPQELQWVDRIQGAGKRLATTIERMIKLLRADALDHTLDARPTEVEPLIRRSIADLEPFLRARRQEVVLDLGPDLGSSEIDPGKFGDVVTNLVVNAIKFTPDGGTIRVEGRAEGPDWLCFRVHDPGVGINACDRDHLFEPFFTGYDVLHHGSGDYQFCRRGIGLGLCLVKTFVEMHGGSVEVLSAPGEGSTFTFRLPRHPGAVMLSPIL